jgi:ABC-2 type transport system ATP-binding protein
VERICDRVAIVDRGRLVAVGSVDELGRSATSRVRVTLRREDLDAGARLLAGYQVGLESTNVILVSAASGREVNEALARGGVYAEAVGMERSGLEERFLALTEGDESATPRG